jgi:hypothetical protein
MQAPRPPEASTDLSAVPRATPPRPIGVSSPRLDSRGTASRRQGDPRGNPSAGHSERPLEGLAPQPSATTELPPTPSGGLTEHPSTPSATTLPTGLQRPFDQPRDDVLHRPRRPVSTTLREGRTEPLTIRLRPPRGPTDRLGTPPPPPSERCSGSDSAGAATTLKEVQRPFDQPFTTSRWAPKDASASLLRRGGGLRRVSAPLDRRPRGAPRRPRQPLRGVSSMGQ